MSSVSICLSARSCQIGATIAQTRRLSAGRTWQKLTKANEIRVGVLIQPSSPLHEFVVKKPKMRGRSTKGGEPLAQKNQKDPNHSLFPWS